MLKGILCCMSANFLFGLGYYFAILLRPLNGESMFGYRIVVLAPFILLAILLFKQTAKFQQLWQKIKLNPPLVLVLLLLALNTGIQLWLFLWAPNNGQAIEVSIGYLLLPIVAVALGKIVFKEHFTLLKWLSLGFAVIGVASNIWLTGSFSWATIVAGVGYPLYITLRRYFEINTLATFFVELLLVMPFAGYFIAQTDMQPILADNQYIYYFLALFGLVNGAAFILYIASSNLLPVNVLGLLGYVEPLVMLCVSFMIGEVLDSKSYLLMICLALAIILLTVDNFRLTRR
ncbi:EamA family transporter RarD [Actinobacillus pleuropneumoniae]|uniref:EamA family transporter RarD n=1 Tax=Actinobacillus pleuropneumoniae TaxID=715 RepID=A0A9Q4DI61_ACTPL|nr:EamA family transporter RarD [Actinobacillus pleuropneumoniae]MCY6367975.1 EamA family transporter RarD [Actinobacillus pleuropneumoniae]MCY6384844.1 EamA family transporter RarD [Actinobacillus pleuropneumoniae]MCY6395555.1 EamA family transporter RarD [Actinobacillus pleuropneumoniae]MCY6397759.1 EamA family transporter RarD [Actinobacillus pleuropneumoniae]MCY6409355.1 EamA family transporter RarD [Actinobacillus pleuropneumoniae]